MRSRRSGPGRPLGDTKVSGRRVTRKAPLAHVEGGSGRSETSPTAILQDTHSVPQGRSALRPHSRGRICSPRMGVRIKGNDQRPFALAGYDVFDGNGEVKSVAPR